jgi:uncharacterized membrane protein
MWLLWVSAAAGIFCVGALLVPVAESQGLRIAPLLRLAYHPGCHQIPGRCLDLGSGPLAVCARCAGLYLGGFIGVAATAVAARSLRPRPVWLLIVALPTGLDVTAGILGLAGLGNWPRFAIAVPLGLICGLYLGDALADAFGRCVDPAPKRAVRECDPVQ